MNISVHIIEGIFKNKTVNHKIEKNVTAFERSRELKVFHA